MIYFDSAATTLQKPSAVSKAASAAMGHMASPGRGGHRPAMLAADTVFRCRVAAAELFHVEEPERVVFTFNATHGLNIAIKTLISPGNTVLISGYEHNAVTRPLHAMGVTIRVASSPLFEPERMLRDFEEKLSSDVAAVVCTYVSNVFGYILPVKEIAALCMRRAVPFILDASQAAGCLPVHQDELNAAFIAMPGHKGLYGPQGTGILLCGGDNAKTLIEGGTGSQSLQQEMPPFLPDQLEAGTHNVTGIAGLLEGIRFVERTGENTILNHERMLLLRTSSGLSPLQNVRLWSDPDGTHQAGVLSFAFLNRDCEEAAEELGKAGFALRAGLHCAPLAHNSVGTLETGTVRASFSAFNTKNEVDRFVEFAKSLSRRDGAGKN